jgi:opacity protein-like surface antigen
MNVKLALIGLMTALVAAAGTAEAQTSTYGGVKDYAIPAPIPYQGAIAVPAPVSVPAPVPVAEGFSYYLRGDLGWGFGGDRAYSETGRVFGAGSDPFVASSPFTSGALAGRHTEEGVFLGTVGMGAYFSPHLRGDITLDMRSGQTVANSAAYSYASATSIGTTVNGTVQDRFTLRNAVGLANLYFDLLPRGSFSPYLGAGVGVVYTDASRTYNELALAESGGSVTATSAVTGSSREQNVALAGALMAGASFSWDHRWALDVGYRALYLGRVDVSTPLSSGETSKVELGPHWEQQARIGLRFNIW